MGSTATTAAGKRRAAARAGARNGSPPRQTSKRPASSVLAPAKRPGKGKAAAGRKPARKRPAARSRTVRRPSTPRWLRLPPLSLSPPRLSAVPWRRLAIVVPVTLGLLAAGYFFYLRDSSLVAVDEVKVEGVQSGQREQIVAALTAAGEEMTTLHVRTGDLDAAVASFPTVESVQADPSFPHGLTIDVIERPPATIARAGGRELPVAADGTLLTGVDPDEDLPVLELDQLPPSGRLTGEALEQALVAGATPEELRPLISDVAYTKDYGVELTMRGGIPIRFGTGARAGAKWDAAAAVLADPKLDALAYVDVRVPERPAAGSAATVSTAG
jgi:cell division protein FtsQ